MRFDVLNIENPIEEQGYGPADFDLVVAANVVHATKNLKNTLGHIKKLLKKQGVVVLDECTRFSSFLNLTFGLLDGWWLFEDEKRRIRHAPLLSVEKWKVTLEEEGFENVFCPGEYRDQLGEHVLVAENNGIVGNNCVPGKKDRPQKKGVVRVDKASPASGMDRKAFIQKTIVSVVAKALQQDEKEIDPEIPYTDFGVDSIVAVKIINRLNDILSVNLRSTELFSFPTVQTLTDHMEERYGKEIESIKTRTSSQNEKTVVAHVVEEKNLFLKTRNAVHASIAVIGMAGRFPGAPDLKAFWRNLSQGINAISETPPERWAWQDYYDPDPKAPNKTHCKWGGFMENVDQFDPLFFNISAREAEQMDPQQRLFLEASWEALEDAGYATKKISGIDCGVFVGTGAGDYQAKLKEEGTPLDAYTLMGNTSSILTARIAYFLNLRGPCVATETACSSSLVALHQACQSIRAGESEMALAGGVCVLSGPGMHIMTSKGNMLSKDGQCKTFDQSADGFVPAEGVGILLLKPLDKAIADGDIIHGVIRGSGINQDGTTNGITAPSAESQKNLELKSIQKS